jgi:competence protein ComEC
VEELPGFVGSRVELWRERVHHSIVRKIHALWAADDAALMDAAVIGESAFLTAGTRVDFQRSGTYHILVVSGMNVSILAFVVFWVMRRSRLSDFLASLLTVILCTAYAFVTDVGPPVWRAVLMLAVYLGVRLLYRGRSMLNALGAAALSVMVADPKSFLGASFQLTFLSVFILGAIAAPVLDRTSQPYLRGLRHLDSPDFDRTLPPQVAQMRMYLRLIAGRLAQFLGGRTSLAILAGTARGTLSTYELLWVSALMQVGLALPMAYYFHRATVMGIPANTLAVPLTGILVPAAVLAVTLSYVWLPLAKIPALVAAVSLHGITGTVRGLGGLRMADHRVAASPAGRVRTRAAGGCRVVGQRRGSEGACPAGSARAYRDGRWAGKLHSSGFAAGQDAAVGRGRSGRGAAIQVRFWRERGVAVFVGTEDFAARCGSDHARTLGSHRRNARCPE